MSTTPSDLERAVQGLRAKQQEYYVQWVKDAIETEAQRKAKLERAPSKDECRRLERQFEKERIKDKERMQQIREDHELILRAKIAEWKTHGVPESALAPSSYASPRTTPAAIENTATPAEAKPKPKVGKLTKATMDRLATPAANVTLSLDVTQDLAFQKDAIRKEDKLRLQRYKTHSHPSTRNDNLKTLTETDLLQRKMSLLTQLHGVVSLQERIVQDDQCTVRSAVSSWKSADFRSTAGSCR